MAGLGDIMGSFTSGFDKVGGVLMYALYGLLFGAILYVGYLFLQYNVKVEIKAKNGEKGFVSTWHKGRFKRDKKNGLLMFTVRGDKRWNQPIDRKYVEVERKAGGRMGYLVRFAEDEEGRLQPIRPMMASDLFSWSGWDNDDIEFAASHARQIIELVKKEDFWSKYGVLIQMGFMALMVVMLIVLFKQLSGVADALGGVATALQNTATYVKTGAEVAGSQVITNG
jgi:hypothetical protein